MYDLIIIGGGPAGLSASVYAARKRLNVLLLTNDIGGQINLTLGIENYLGYQFIEGPTLIGEFEKQVNQFPIERKIGTKVSNLAKIESGFVAIAESGEEYQSKAVIIAAGKRPRLLNIPGEVELTGRGVSYCAICDGPIYSDQRVAIVGAGNSGLEAVLDMVKIARHVDLVALEITADQILIDKSSATKNLTIYTGHQSEKIVGETLVEAIQIKNLKTNESKKLEVTGVFIEIGMVPNAEPVKKLLKLNGRGEIPVNCSSETEITGLFAAGDVTSVPEKQIVVAAGEGAKAALQAHRYLQRLTS